MSDTAFDDLFGSPEPWLGPKPVPEYANYVRKCFGWEQAASVLRQWVERAELVDCCVTVRRTNGLWELRVCLMPSQRERLARLDALRRQEQGAAAEGEDDIEQARRIAG